MPWILVCLLLTILAAYLSVTLAETPANIRDISEFSIIIPAADPHVGGDPDISSTVEVTQSVSSSGSEGGIVPAVQPLGVVSPPLHTPLPSLHHSPVAVDRLPSYRYRPVSQTRTDRLEELGKSLIVVPPAKARILPEDYNGLYPPLRRRKN